MPNLIKIGVGHFQKSKMLPEIFSFDTKADISSYEGAKRLQMKKDLDILEFRSMPRSRGGGPRP